MLIDRFNSRERLEAILFSQKDDLGRSLYFPSGLLGAGYVVATNDQKERILQSYIFRADILIVALLGAVLAMTFFNLPFLTILPIIILALVIFPLVAQRDVEGLERSQITLTRSQAHRAMAKLFEWRVHLIAGIMLFVGVALRLFRSPSWENASITTIIGLTVVGLAYFSYLERRNRE